MNKGNHAMMLHRGGPDSSLLSYLPLLATAFSLPQVRAGTALAAQAVFVRLTTQDKCNRDRLGANSRAVALWGR
jgi:hypothetical protein